MRKIRVYKYNLFITATRCGGAIPARRGRATFVASFLLGLGATGGALWAVTHRPHLSGLAAKLTWLKDLGHYPMLERPSEWADAAVGFIETKASPR